MKKIFQVCYDIESDRIRKKIADRLTDEGLERLQYSVFIGPISDNRMNQLELWLEGILEKSEGMQDSISILRVQQQDLEKMTILGLSRIDPVELSGMRHTLFI